VKQYTAYLSDWDAGLQQHQPAPPASTSQAAWQPLVAGQQQVQR